MLPSESGLHFWVALGNDWVSHMAMPNQNVMWSWKLSVPAVPAWLGATGGSFGSRTV